MDRPPHARFRLPESLSPRSSPAHAPAAADPPLPDRLSTDAGGGTRFPLIVHCHLRWDFVWQRPQQIFSRLATQHPVLFIEEPQPGAEPGLDISSPMDGVMRMVRNYPRVLPLTSMVNGGCCCR